MKICGICQRKSLKKLPRDMFLDKIGDNPPVLISELLMKLTAGVDLQFVSNEICRKCTRKMSQYYSAKQLMEKLKNEIIQLIQSKIQTDYKTEVDCLMKTKLRSTSTASLMSDTDLSTEHNEKYKHNSETVEGNLLEMNFENCDSNTTINKLNINNYDINPITNHEFRVNEIVGNSPPTKNLLIDCDVTDGLNKSIIDCSNSIGVPTFRSTGKGKPTGIKCEFCDKVYENHKTFQAHKKYGYEFSGYVCELCGTTLYSKSGFTIHTKSHQTQKEYQCTECGAEFHRKTKLTHHLAWHKGDKPFQCEICAKCFVHRVALTKHRHIHSDANRRNECKICGNKFRTLTHLTRHMTIHTGAKPFSCPICGKCFSQAYNMKSHIKQHEHPSENTFKRYHCEKCLKSFVRSNKYEEHAQHCT